MATTEPDKQPEPIDVLRAILAVSPEDAAEVRGIADVKAKPDAPHIGERSDGSGE